ncbi:MAG: hypothetical protein K0S36_1351 [Nitrosospira multiformis]|jgi:hypothetical protein|nr:hypothetical protein [Nitrosospira multiformis]
MRALFFLLLFINLAFALYIQLEPDESSRASLPAELQAKTGPSSEAAPPPPSVCLEWEAFAQPDVSHVEAAISRHDLDGKLKPRIMGMVPYYWVHIPPLMNKQHAERKIGELKRRDITTYQIVEGDSKWNNAISLGFFEKIEDARAFLAALRTKRVVSAIIGARNVEQVKFVAENSSPDLEGQLEKLKVEFPNSRITKTTCEPSAGTHGKANTGAQ